MIVKFFEFGVQLVEDKIFLSLGGSIEVLGNLQFINFLGFFEDSDLVIVLYCFSLRRQNYLSEKQFFVEEWEWKIQILVEQEEEVSSCDVFMENFVLVCIDQLEIMDFGSVSCF